MDRDAARIDAEKPNFWEAKHVIEADFNKLVDQDKLATTDILTK